MNIYDFDEQIKLAKNFKIRSAETVILGSMYFCLDMIITLDTMMRLNIAI